MNPYLKPRCVGRCYQNPPRPCCVITRALPSPLAAATRCPSLDLKEADNHKTSCTEQPAGKKKNGVRDSNPAGWRRRGSARLRPPSFESRGDFRRYCPLQRLVACVFRARRRGLGKTCRVSSQRSQSPTKAVNSGVCVCRLSARMTIINHCLDTLCFCGNRCRRCILA